MNENFYNSNADRWYEVWVDESPGYPYVLVLRPNESKPEELLIIDPKEGNKIIYRASSYDEARLWLLEDEFDIVEGRMGLE